jgi:RHH-type proline utilization regulon transcriptional repressor/proline dehydrogenase/delta 1-pyrroline-5-carboxylate dehydrogenase
MQLSEFQNAPNTDFSIAANRDAMRQALGKSVPMQTYTSAFPSPAVKTFASVNPSAPSQEIGRCARHNAQDADRAVRQARKGFDVWRNVPVEERCRTLERLATLLEEHRTELTVLEAREVGKPVLEADADISEAIDFCRYYAHQMRLLALPRRTQQVAGEDCHQLWAPRGVAAVIAPWNFPIAILCGMTTAALVTGNAVIMKPAEQSAVLGIRFNDLLQEALMPVFAGDSAGSPILLTGFGEDVGAALVSHPDVDIISFTGSRAVGCAIWEAAGKTAPGQRNLKKVICEMGGKNALIIDSTADLDEAVLGSIRSAFGYAGQKCSALSRLIVLADCHDRFIERLVAAAAAIKVGRPDQDMGVDMGPLIEADAVERCRRYRDVGVQDGKLAFEGKIPSGEGYFFPPTIFTGIAPASRLFREEIFGPILSVTRAATFDEALVLANDSDYALTGGVYSRSPVNLERAKREFMVGNLYLNRPITGAIVERHPFGGFRMSGGGTKAGGAEYLQNFLFPRVIAENTLRRGFAPE